MDLGVKLLTALPIGFGQEQKNPAPWIMNGRNSTKTPLNINTTLPTNIITMVFRLPPLRRRFNESPQSDACAAIPKGWPRAVRRGFI